MPSRGFEPPRIAPHASETCLSTNSNTTAKLKSTIVLAYQPACRQAGSNTTANTIFYLKSAKITLRGYSLVVELKISNLSARVRFPLPAPRTTPAAVVKSVYTQDLKSCALNKRVGSSPASGTLSVCFGH